MKILILINYFSGRLIQGRVGGEYGEKKNLPATAEPAVVVVIGGGDTFVVLIGLIGEIIRDFKIFEISGFPAIDVCKV